jgi:hypothetical protein
VSRSAQRAFSPLAYAKAIRSSSPCDDMHFLPRHHPRLQARFGERRSAPKTTREIHLASLNKERKDEIVIMKDRTIASTHRLRATVHVATLMLIAVILGAAVSACGGTGSARDGSEPAPTAGAPATEEPTSPALVAEG